jgi:gamma-glutamyltranspeptidase
MTTTINTLFGSQVMVPETGVILNNEMNGEPYATSLHDRTLNVRQTSAYQEFRTIKASVRYKTNAKYQ